MSTKATVLLAHAAACVAAGQPVLLVRPDPAAPAGMRLEVWR